MDKSTAAENTPGKPIASDEQRGIRTADLLFNAATLGGALVACAIGGWKSPWWEGDFCLSG